MSQPPETLKTIDAKEAERNLLTSVIQHPEALDDLPGFGAMDFYWPDHKAVAAAVLALRNAQIKPDRVTINEQVAKNYTVLKQDRPETLDQPFINGLCDDEVPFGIHEDYYRLVVEKATLRSIAKFCADQSRECYEFGIGDDLQTFVSKMEEKVLRFRADRNARETTKDGREVMKSNAAAVAASETETGIPKTGLPCGFPEIDQHKAGLQPTEVVVIAARPSAGKTALMMHVILHAALRSNVNTAVFSLEMSADQLMERAASMISGVGTMDLKRGQVTADERAKWMAAYELVKTDSISIDDSNDLTIEDIRARARRLYREKDIKLIAIDYLQLIKSPVSDRFTTTDDKISAISSGVKQMAKELRVPVLVLAQLNRELEKREDRRPRLSDLRSSGAIEQDADDVWAIYREHGIGNPNFDILSLKGRNSGLFKDAHFLFDADTQRFEGISDAQMDLL